MASTKKVYIDVKSKGTSKTKKELADVDRGISSLKKSAIAAGLGIVSLAGAMAVLRKGLEMGELGAQAADVGRAFENMAIGPELMLRNMKLASAGTISELELMKKFNTAAMLGLPLDQFDKMMIIARSAAKATGLSMEYMLTSIVTGIGRQSRLMLDNLGIIVSAGEANEVYAKILRKEAKDLTELERKQAFANLAVEKGMKNVEKAGGIIASTADDYAFAKAQLQDLQVEIGKTIDPWFANLSKAAGEAFGNMRLGLRMLTGTTKENEMAVLALAAAEQYLIDYEEELEGFRNKGSKSALRMVNLIEMQKDEIIRLTEVIEGLAEAEIKAAADETLAEKLRKDKLAAEELADEVARITREMEAFDPNKMQGLAEALQFEGAAEIKFRAGWELPERPEADLPDEDDALNILYLSDAFNTLTDAEKLAVQGIEDMAAGLFDALIYGQKFGPAIVASLKAISSQLIKDAAIYAIMTFLTGGTMSFAGFGKFALGGAGAVPISPPLGDFIWRQGQPPQTFSPQDNLIGTKAFGVEDLIDRQPPSITQPQGDTIINMNFGDIYGTTERELRKVLMPMMQKVLND